MRWVSVSVLAAGAALAFGGSARGQLLPEGTYAGPSSGSFPQPGGLYTTLSVPGMGRGGRA